MPEGSAPEGIEPSTRQADEIAVDKVSVGDVIKLRDGRVAVVVGTTRHAVSVLLERAPGQFKPKHRPPPKDLPQSEIGEVLYRIHTGDFVVTWAGRIGIVVDLHMPFMEVRHMAAGAWDKDPWSYAPGDLALASQDQVSAWKAAGGDVEAQSAGRSSSRVGLDELTKLVLDTWSPGPIAPAGARPGDLVMITGRLVMLGGKPANLRAYLQDEDAGHDVKVRDVQTVVHRLDDGDYVVAGISTTLGRGYELGHIESIQTDRDHLLQFGVRSLVGGRRWAKHYTFRPAKDVWPVSREVAEALLTEKGLPMPPVPPRRSGGTVAASHLPAVGASLPALPGLPAAAATAEPEPVGPPMPAGEFTDLFSKVAFPGQLRRYQAMAIDAFEKSRASGRRRAYLILPPGAGKTLVGLEIARRLGNRTLALGPNTAIQEQWIKQWREYQPNLVEGSDSTELKAPITALTYQSICNLDSHNPALDEQIAEWQAALDGDHPATVDGNPHHAADVARLRGNARKLVAQSGDHQKLLDILHPNGRKLIERIKAAGQVTILLDECHHLLEMWGYLLRALVAELGDGVFLVGLTATPPSEMDAREAVLYQELFGHADFEVPTPAVVKEGNLAPYQELAYLTTPLQHETDYIAEERTRFEELVTEMMRPDLGTISFLDWLRARVFERQTKDGVPVAWPRFESDHPQLALAALRYCTANQLEVPEGARVGEAERQPITADGWVVLIGDYAIGHLRESADPKDLEAWETIRQALPSLGYVLTRQGIRSSVSPVDRVLLLSGSKGVAAIEILAAESRALGGNLRALVLCDYEVAGSDLVGKLRGVLDAQAGSAALLLKTLLSDQGSAALDPILVTGQTVACSRATAAALVPWLGEQLPDLRGRLHPAELFKDAAGEGGGWESVVEIKPSSGAWQSSLYLPLLTRYFEEGRAHCLIGTRGLLGEGWDAKSIKVLIDVTGVTTTTSVHQMRGRSLRLDPKLPHKVANNWDVVCVARDHPKGAADYDRFVRKHRNYFAITSAGEIESGVGHVDQRLSPFGPPADAVVATVNVDTLGRSESREQIYDLWGIGKPYENLPTQTVRIRSRRPLGLPTLGMLAARPGLASPPLLRARAAGGVVAGGVAVAVGLVAGSDLLGILVGAGLVSAGVGSAVVSLRTFAGLLGPSSAVEDLGAAVVEALAAAHLIDPRLDASAVRLVTQPDGYYRCYLAGARLQDSATFATALDELLAPLQAPRYIIPRYVSSPPRNLLEGLGLLARQFGNIRFGATVVYHAVPTALAANKARVQLFEAAWNGHVSAGRALYLEDPRAQAIIELQRGEDPFAVTTQMRTLWQ